MKKVKLDWSNLGFGYIKTKCHIQYRWKNGEWDEGKLVRSDEIKLNIASACLHYGQECFEGLKIYKAKDGRILSFRIEENAKRLIKSAERIFMPIVPIDMFKSAVYKVVKENVEYIPPYGSGATLYVRPLLIATQARVGLGPADEYLFLVFVTPVGPYYKTGFKPVKALVVEEFDRAAPKGVGDCKVAGNYAAGLRGSELGKKLGYPIVLYLDPKEKKYIDEFATSNFFSITRDGKYITPNSETILPSITNMSLLEIAKDIGLGVEKREVGIDELPNFIEVGATGTAAVITPVYLIHFRGKDYLFGDENKAGEITTKLYENLKGIQFGDLEDKYGWVEEVS